MKRLLCPSMMYANYGHLASEVRALDDAGVDKISGESVPSVNYISVELKMRDSTR